MRNIFLNFLSRQIWRRFRCSVSSEMIDKSFLTLRTDGKSIQAMIRLDTGVLYLEFFFSSFIYYKVVRFFFLSSFFSFFSPFCDTFGFIIKIPPDIRRIGTRWEFLRLRFAKLRESLLSFLSIYLFIYIYIYFFFFFFHT